MELGFFVFFFPLLVNHLGEILTSKVFRCHRARPMRQFAVEGPHHQRGATYDYHGYGGKSLSQERDPYHFSRAATAFHVRAEPLVLSAGRLDADQPRLRRLLVGFSRIVALDGRLRREHHGGGHRGLAIRPLAHPGRARDPGQEGRRLYPLVDLASAFEILAKLQVPFSLSGERAFARNRLPQV